MVRSLWKRTLVTTFAWAGMAWGQSMPSLPSTQPPKPTETSERLVTLQESGKPAQKCRILKSWKTAEGATAYRVQALDSGEIMTIVENGPATTVPGSREGTHKQALATRIFHWGRDGTPPAGTPIPPDEQVRTTPTAPDRPSASTVSVPVPPSPQKP
jgi:hypothetical protein